MADELLCFDIHQEMVIAVALQNSARGQRVLGCLHIDLGSQSFAAAIDKIRQHFSGIGGKCRVTFGAEMFSFRNLNLPFSEKKKIEQVLPMELAELTPYNVDSLLIDHTISMTGLQGSDILAASIERATLVEYLAVLRESGFDPESIGVSGIDLAISLRETGGGNYALLDIDHSWATLFLVRNGRIVAIRSQKGLTQNDAADSKIKRLDLFVKQTLLGCRFPEMQENGVVLYHNGSMPYLVVPPGFSLQKYVSVSQSVPGGDATVKADCRPECLDRCLASGLRQNKHASVFNFYKDELRMTKTLREYRRRFILSAAPIVFCCVCAGLYFHYEYRQMARQQEDLRRQIAEVFSATAPLVTRIVQPVQQMQILINEVKATYRPGAIATERYSVIDLLSEISTRIPAAYPVKVVRLVADAEALLLKAVTRDFNTVDNVQKELKKSPLFKEVVISSANQEPQGDEVSFEMKLVLVGK